MHEKATAPGRHDAAAARSLNRPARGMRTNRKTLRSGVRRRQKRRDIDWGHVIAAAISAAGLIVAALVAAAYRH